jgi:hypothetical protein
MGTSPQSLDMWVQPGQSDQADVKTSRKSEKEGLEAEAERAF